MATTFTREYQGVQVSDAGTYVLDKGHTTIEFVGRHLMITKVRGRFTDFDGQIVIGESPADSSVDVTINAASVYSSDEKRDGHLRSPDFSTSRTTRPSPSTARRSTSGGTARPRSPGT